MISTNVSSRFLLGPISLLVAGALNGCGSNTASNSSAPPPSVSATSAPAGEEGRSSTGPVVKPPKGFGNAQGRVLWNDKPAANIKVTLCQSVSMLGGCTGKSYSARTDKDGNYTVDKVPPGNYGLAVQVFDTDSFVYPTTGAISAAKFAVKEGETLDIRATNLYKTDVQVITPKAGETVKSGLPKLNWKAYPGADKYEVTLSAAQGGASQNLESAATSVSPESPLLNGSYRWEVVARNANGTKIASTRAGTPFKVVGQAGSAVVDLISPARDASVAGSGLKFSWKANTLANGYEIYLASVKGGAPVLSFVKVATPSYSLDKTLEPGTYFWSVNATRDGTKIASSELKPFKVK